ncbi:MAG: hypothetical protein LBS27_06095 [Bifidobacteriaceae bacterium]|jgi:hypothetical protein|nr:hypothetical protein [Bifidobacteriaceae bacterium]
MTEKPYPPTVGDHLPNPAIAVAVAMLAAFLAAKAAVLLNRFAQAWPLPFGSLLGLDALLGLLLLLVSMLMVISSWIWVPILAYWVCDWVCDWVCEAAENWEDPPAWAQGLSKFAAVVYGIACGLYEAICSSLMGNSLAETFGAYTWWEPGLSGLVGLAGVSWGLLRTVYDRCIWYPRAMAKWKREEHAAELRRRAAQIADERARRERERNAARDPLRGGRGTIGATMDGIRRELGEG